MRRQYSNELYAMFSKEKVLDLTTICQAFPDRSKVSIVRYLQKVRAISSCNHCGRHYTLREVADFNEHGFWQHGNALFSAHGNLKQAIAVMVGESDAGMTHSELHAILGMRVHDTLLEMVKDSQIGREAVCGIYVYLSEDTARSLAQLAKRRALHDGSRGLSDPMAIIEVLSFVIQNPKATKGDAYEHFKNAGLSPEAVDAIFERYVHGKKN